MILYHNKITFLKKGTKNW